MKKVLGITFGGLQQKIINLVLALILVTVALFAGVSYYQSRMLSSIVNEAGEDQRVSIAQISEETMHTQLESSFVKVSDLQAEIADNDFAEIINYIYVMQSLAQGLFENQDNFEPAVVNPPDPSLDGTPTAQVLWDEGVDYTKSQSIGIVGHMEDTLLALYNNCPKILACFVGLADGTHLSIDRNSANRFDENGDQIPYPVTRRPWFVGAAETGGLYFTGIELDAFSHEPGITCSAPVYYKDELVAVVGMDLHLEKMNSFVRSSSENGGFLFVVNDRGQIVLSSDANDYFNGKAVDQTTLQAMDLRNTENEEFSGFMEKALQENTGLTEMTLLGKDYYLVGSPMPTVGWAVVMMVDKELTEQPAREMVGAMNEINLDAAAKFKSGRATVTRNTVLMILLILILGFNAAAMVANRVVRPVEEMTKNIIESSRTGKLFEMKEIYRTKDEIEVLAEAFDDLSKKTRKYIQDITRITREKERISTELELARKIQADMLPYIYPAFPDRPEFDIYATMNPAREVGGDFYDFFLIDPNHLGMVVADVSGKGVPAALFMMMSKILINNFAMMGDSPARVLERTNYVICQNNEDEMFVTAWFGILEISTGKITAANAGHEYPILKKAGGEYELMKDKHGFVLGAFDDMKYQDYEFALGKGGMLFLYTDGVPESTNEKNELFGVRRLIETLNKSEASGPVDLLSVVRRSVNEFAGEAEQFDDLTMLGITLR